MGCSVENKWKEREKKGGKGNKVKMKGGKVDQVKKRGKWNEKINRLSQTS